MYLTPDQTLYTQSRLSIIKSAFLCGHYQQINHLGVSHLPDDHADHLSSCGAKVWSIVDSAASPALVSVVVESQHPDGNGMVTLLPEEALHIQERLTQITLAFLHENIWGGEDAGRA